MMACGLIFSSEVLARLARHSLVPLGSQVTPAPLLSEVLCDLSPYRSLPAIYVCLPGQKDQPNHWHGQHDRRQQNGAEQFMCGQRRTHLHLFSSQLAARGDTPRDSRILWQRRQPTPPAWATVSLPPSPPVSTPHTALPWPPSQACVKQPPIARPPLWERQSTR